MDAAAKPGHDGKMTFLPRSPAAGMALVAFGAIGFGLMPLFARTAYAEGLPPLSLLVWRFALASLCLLPFAPRLLAARRDALVAIATGIGYMGMTFFYFLALEHLTVALTVLILFTYPLFAILVGWLFFREALTMGNAAAALLVLVAALLILSPGLDRNVHLPAIGMAFIPPLAYAVFVHVAAKRLSRAAIPVRLGGVFLGGLIAMLALAPILEGGVVVPASPLAWAAAAALALISTVGALGLLLIGAPAAGAERTAIAGAGELVTALAVGVLAYGESIDLRTLMGAGLIVIALVLAARSQSRPHAEG